MQIELASRTVPLTAGGVPGSALGMMSRGKVNALALSVFLPRATMPASPRSARDIRNPLVPNGPRCTFPPSGMSLVSRAGNSVVYFC